MIDDYTGNSYQQLGADNYLTHSRPKQPVKTMLNESQDIRCLVADSSGCCNVYVANLPPSADALTIRKLFESVGKVLHVKLLLDIASGVSRGICFVMFESIDMARRACAMKNKAVLDGNVLQVRLAERSALHSSPDAHVRSTVVYIRNIPGHITHDTVKTYCEERFGPVSEVTPHPQSAEVKGPSPFNMDFVVFKSIDDACRCVEFVDGRATFPMPAHHPFTMAKMITDVAGEMRKSILLRRRSSDSNSIRRGSEQKTNILESRRQSENTMCGTPPSQLPFVQQSQLSVNPQFQPFCQPFPQSFVPQPLQYQSVNPTPTLQQFRQNSFEGQHSNQVGICNSQFNSSQFNINHGGQGTHNCSPFAPNVVQISGINQFVDSQHSHRSSIETHSLLASQRTSLIMNTPHGTPLRVGSFVYETSAGSSFPQLQNGNSVQPPQYYQHQVNLMNCPSQLHFEQSTHSLPVTNNQFACQHNLGMGQMQQQQQHRQQQFLYPLVNQNPINQML